MTQVVTELVIDARPAEQGAQVYARAMDLAEAAGDRVVAQTRAVDQAIANQTSTMTRSVDTTGSAQRAFDRLRNSVDPVSRAQDALERATRTLDGAVTRGITTQEEAARVLELVRQKYDAAGDEADQYGSRAGRASSATDKASQAVNRLTGMLATLGLALGVRQLIEYADAWTNAGNRIAAVTGGTVEQVGEMRAAIADLAVETRGQLDATTALATRLFAMQGDIGASAEEILRVTRTVNQALVVGGASASEAASTVRQLAQALGSGVFRGDEFNSIMENSLPIARAVVDQVNLLFHTLAPDSEFVRGVAEKITINQENWQEYIITIGDLRKLAEEGLLTSDIVFDALMNASAGIEEQFARTQTTVGQAMTNLTTRFIEFVGGTNDATGASTALVAVLEFVADNIGAVSIALGVLGAAFVAVKVAEFIGSLSSLGAAFAGLKVAMSFLLTTPLGLAITAVATIVGGIILMRGRTEEASVSMEAHEAIVDRVKTAYEAAAGSVDDWASTIEGLTSSEAMLNISARAQDLADAQAALDVRPTFADGNEQQRQLASSIAALKDALTQGEISLATFNAATDTLAENGLVTARFAVDQQNLAAAFDAARTASDQANAVYRVMQGTATDADFAILGLNQRLEDGADVANDLADAAARAATEINNMNAAAGGGPIAVATTPPTVPATQFHAGGVVGSGGVSRSVPASVFIGAPRFHTGLASDEFPAILQRGETVIPAGGSIAAVPAAATGSVTELTKGIKDATKAAVDFGVSFVQALMSAQSPLEALQASLSSLSSSMLSSAGQSFMTGNFGAGIIKGIIGLVAGFIARRIQERRELAAAQEAWRDLSDEVGAFARRLAGGVEGSLDQAIASATAEMQPFIDAARKAKASTAELEQQLEQYAQRVSAEFMVSFPMMIEALEAGFGPGGPVMTAATNVAAIGKELQGFVADTKTATETLHGNAAAIAVAEAAAQDYALSLLGTAPELSEVQKELMRIDGTAVALAGVLEDLGMSSAAAAAAIDDGVAAAIDDLRRSFADELGAKLNDALGKGYLNEAAELIDEAMQLLADASALGIAGTDVSRYFAAQAQAIVDGADLTGDAFAELIALFPQLAGVVHESSESVEEAMDRINDAAAGVLDYVRGLMSGSSSTLSPEARLANAQKTYDAQLALAQSGDVAAQGKLPGFADDLLEAARTMFASSAGYQDIFARVTGQLLGLSSVQQTTDPANAALRQSLGGVAVPVPALSIAPAASALIGISTPSAAAPVPANDQGAALAVRQNFVDLMQVTNSGQGAIVIAIREEMAALRQEQAETRRAMQAWRDAPRQAGGTGRWGR